MPFSGSSHLSLWSTDSVLSIGSHGSVLSIGSIGSIASIGSIGSAGSILSVGSALSTGSALSWRSRWSLLADQSFGTALSSHGHARAVTGPPAAFAAIAAAAYAGYLLTRGRHRHVPAADRRSARRRRPDPDKTLAGR
jgi:hypothetical protein